MTVIPRYGDIIVVNKFLEPARPDTAITKKYYVYILKCADASYYIGVTNDINRRVVEHQEAHDPSSYTAQRLPIELVHIEICKYVEDAIERKTKLKKWSHAKKTALINGDFKSLRAASKKRNWNRENNGQPCQAE